MAGFLRGGNMLMSVLKFQDERLLCNDSQIYLTSDSPFQETVHGICLP